MRFPLLCLLAFLALERASADDDHFFKRNDIVALVGGEEMVTASECGHFEYWAHVCLPDDHLRFRSLAWEGDTVFEQRRDLNFPSWEEALDKIGATLVIAQFGQMESLAGKEKLPEFIAAYRKLISRLSDGGKRRVAIIAPLDFGQSPTNLPHDDPRSARIEELRKHNEVLHSYNGAMRDMATELNVGFIYLPLLPESKTPLQRDGVHLTDAGQFRMADYFAIETRTMVSMPANPKYYMIGRLLPTIREKDRLWFNYWRVQNWAFLAGDRTNQPSSRDHLDPSKRWFPSEREEFLPLIEAKEKEIDALSELVK